MDAESGRHGKGPNRRNRSSSNPAGATGNDPRHLDAMSQFTYTWSLPLQYIIANLGMSHAFGAVDLDHLTFPTTMRIDYIRVYQPKDAINIGCDPADFPTADYIDTYVPI